MPFSHVGIPVGDHYTQMRDFYKATLEPLGYTLIFEGKAKQPYCAFGIKGSSPDFWLGGGCSDGLQKYGGELEKRVAPIHIAFDGKDQRAVDEWFENAILNGATDNGKPGYRKEYKKNYYAAFVLDPLGNNIEIVYLDN